VPLWFWECQYGKEASPWFTMMTDPTDPTDFIFEGDGLWDGGGHPVRWLIESFK